MIALIDYSHYLAFVSLTLLHYGLMGPWILEDCGIKLSSTEDHLTLLPLSFISRAKTPPTRELTPSLCKGALYFTLNIRAILLGKYVLLFNAFLTTTKGCNILDNINVQCSTESYSKL